MAVCVGTICTAACQTCQTPLIALLRVQMVKVHINNTKHITIANIYIPPRDTTSTHYKTADTDIQHCIQYMNIPHSVLTGDVNAARGGIITLINITFTTTDIPSTIHTHNTELQMVNVYINHTKWQTSRTYQRARCTAISQLQTFIYLLETAHPRTTKQHFTNIPH